MLVFAVTKSGGWHGPEPLLGADGKPVTAEMPGLTRDQAMRSAPWLVDTDDDQDLDLLIGTLGGQIVHVLNAGTPRSPKFTTKTLLHAADQPLGVNGAASPCTGDWDGDELRDLVVGACDGSVTLFRNVGTRAKPKFAAGDTLIERLPTQFEGAYHADLTRSGGYTRPVIVDYDGDGQRDLLVGDTTPFDSATRLDPVRHAERLRLVARRDDLAAELAELLPLNPSGRQPQRLQLGKEQAQRFFALSAESQQILQRIAELEKQGQPKDAAAPEAGGGVWVFPRQSLPWRNPKGGELRGGQKADGK